MNNAQTSDTNSRQRERPAGNDRAPKTLKSRSTLIGDFVMVALTAILVTTLAWWTVWLRYPPHPLGSVIAVRCGDPSINRVFWDYSAACHAFETGDYDAAILKYSEVIRHYPKLAAVAYWRRGLAYYGKGEYEPAIADIDRALDFKPRTATVTAGMLRVRGLTWLAKGERTRGRADLERAEALGYDSQGRWELLYIEPVIRRRAQFVGY